MQTTDDILQATLLLTTYFNKKEVKEVKPLTPTEYGRFAIWLHQRGFTPASLLSHAGDILANWSDPKGKIKTQRIQALLARKVSMAFALESWEQAGVWVISRASRAYPRRLREALGDSRPPVLFGVGNQALLNTRSVGFVGSREVAEDDEAFARSKAELAVSQGYCVVSGGAAGVDQAAMLAALACGGLSLGILSDSLLKSATSKIYREGLRSNCLALVSPFYPEAGFSTGNAMARNKYIYAMSESVVVVKSDLEKGGTWAGASENLRKQWAPLLVRDCPYAGNQALLNLGGIPFADSFTVFQPVVRPAGELFD
ncbi:MAG: DNA-protecting protein DprA [Hahellaceae bacterium]|nr:DNA-protecting protein DprA [Hahellaceae bacterium]